MQPGALCECTIQSKANHRRNIATYTKGAGQLTKRTVRLDEVGDPFVAVLVVEFLQLSYSIAAQYELCMRRHAGGGNL